MTARPKAQYIKATFPVPAAMADEAAGMLIAHGAMGCAVAEIHKPGRRPPKVVTLEAYFFPSDANCISGLRAMLGDAGMLALRRRPGRPQAIEDPGWATLWQEGFAPFRIGRRFLIVPPWDVRHEAGRISIAIKPGLGFGTGHHPSTAGVLRVIETRFAEEPPVRTALDIGTGSGILAFAMAALGARVIAIDVDRDALQNARENAELNRGARRTRFSATPLERIHARFDLIAANILSGTLIEMAPAIVKRLKPGGMLVLGGILAREARQVRSAYRSLRVASTMRNRGWATIVMVK
jgi:ribosomal protein L11 methyltransferase